MAFSEGRSAAGSDAMSQTKGGALRTHDSPIGRAALALIFGGALMVMPLALLASPRSSASSIGHERASGAPPPSAASELLMPPSELVDFAAFATSRGPTTPAPAPAPAPAATPPAPAPVPAATPPAATPPAPAATPQAATPPAPAATPPAATPPAATPPAATPPATLSGEATWYPEASPGTCASPTLPFGTTVRVVAAATGASTTCVVDDREGSNPGRVLDMSATGFSQIATPGQGVVTVTISW